MFRRLSLISLILLPIVLLAGLVRISSAGGNAFDRARAKQQDQATGTGIEAGLDAPPPLEVLMNQVLSGTVIAYDGALSGERPIIAAGQPYTIETRYTFSGESIQAATRYVGGHLEDLGLPVEYHVWASSAPPDPRTYPNVIGELIGQTYPDEIMLIGAHLDSTSTDPMTAAPGADDNASGSTAVMIAADILSQYQWDCTLRFAFWTGEEQGKHGSEAYAQRSSAAGEKIRGVLNLDMISWNTSGSEPIINLYGNKDLVGSMPIALIFSKIVHEYDLDLVPEVYPYGRSNSDHASFWEQGYPAILAIEDRWDFNPYYHTTNDKLSNLDIDYFTEFVRAAVGTFALMADCGSFPQIPTFYFPLLQPAG